MTAPAEVEARLRAHAWTLCRTIGERTILRGLRDAERAIHEALDETGLPVEHQGYSWCGVRVANLVAHAGPATGRPLIVGAHYDTVRGTEGADDNASAVCVLLELAHRLARHPPSVPVRLVAFTLEEGPAFGTPKQGSRVFVRHLRESGVRPRGAIVLEMVGYTAERQGYPGPIRYAGYPGTGDFLAIVGNLRSWCFMRTTARGFRRNRALPVETLTVPLSGWPLPDIRRSDHVSFWDVGWPAVMATDTSFFRNPHYHTAGDRYETLDFAFMANVAEGAELAVRAAGERVSARAPGRDPESA